MGLVKGLHHVSMKCWGPTQYADVVHFYKDVLGLEVLRMWHNGIMFDTGCGVVEVFTDGVAALDKGAIRHFSFLTDDVDACVAACKAAGYEAFIAPNDLTIDSTPAYPIRMAFVKGPLGEDIEFLQEK